VTRVVPQVPGREDEKAHEKQRGDGLPPGARRPSKGSGPGGDGEDQQHGQDRQPIAVEAVHGHV
jgi:hypothetical protein